jgi:hypothetical protein
MEIISNVELSKNTENMIWHFANFIDAQRVEYYDDGKGEKYVFDKNGKRGYIYVSSLPEHGAWLNFEIEE